MIRIKHLAKTFRNTTGLDDRGELAPGKRADQLRARMVDGMPMVVALCPRRRLNGKNASGGRGSPDGNAPPHPVLEGVDMSEARYAVYFAPLEGSGLERVCAAVLGRCARTGRTLAQPALPGVTSARLAELTAAPRRYGFHGTLKPPFFLAEGVGEADLFAATTKLAASRMAFDLPPLRLDDIGSFLALIPSAPCPELEELARACVIELDRFRRPPGPVELARHRGKGLTAAQDHLLEWWGYPYVLEEFRFHMTLTGGAPDADERERIRAALSTLFAPLADHPVPVREISVFRQPGPDEPFTVLRDFALLSRP
jgi:putative phosphonate metabolism protein